MRPWLAYLLLTASPAAAQIKISVYVNNIVLSSDGPAGDYHGGRLGVYERVTGGAFGCPAYRQRDTVGGEVNYLYRAADKDWLIGPELKGNKAALRNKKRLDKCLLPTTGWEYTRKRTWQPDSSLTISKVSTITPVRSMGICSQVIIRGNSRVTKSSHVIDTDRNFELSHLVIEIFQFLVALATLGLCLSLPPNLPPSLPISLRHTCH